LPPAGACRRPFVESFPFVTDEFLVRPNRENISPEQANYFGANSELAELEQGIRE
jgi:hypothetical protein